MTDDDTRAATPSGAETEAPRVVLLGRAGCHLCDDARELVRAEAGRAGATWGEVDVDTDPALRDEYGDLVPVVQVDGVTVGYWRIDAARLRAGLAATRRTP